MITTPLLLIAPLTAPNLCVLDGLPPPQPTALETLEAKYFAPGEAREALVDPSADPLALQVQAASGAHSYLRISAGGVTTKDSDGPNANEDIEFDEGLLIGLALGYRFNSTNSVHFALELEGVWDDQNADDNGPINALDEVTVGILFVNGHLDWNLTPQFGIYGAAGLGPAWVDVGTKSDALNSFDEEDGPFLAWQARAGVFWNFTNSATLNFGYRFINIDDVKITDDIGTSSFDLQTEQHVLELGLRFGI